MDNENTAELFLEGRWEDGDTYPSYFEMYKDNDIWHSQSNLPHKDVDGYYSINNGVYSVESTKYFKFSIINEDTISVYCYKDGSTYKLYRQ